MKKLAEGESPLKAAASAGLAGSKERIMQMFGRAGKAGKGGKGRLKVINIVESADVGVPLRVAYNQWTQFAQFPTFMKKAESVEQASEEKLNWKAQVFWSHRTWEATIVEQVPDQHIVWRSKGAKGHVDGAVTFHELAPNLTRILLVLEYHPQGLFEKTGNLWRAQGRRARLEFKHFVRHVMTRTILEQDEVEGWRGEIRDSEVVRDHETALEEERRQREEEGFADHDEEPEAEEDGYADEPEERRVPQARRPRTRPARPARRPTREKAER
jgi:hypothetical protein